MQSYKVTLFGHRDLYRYNRIEEKLYLLLRDLICEKAYLEIYIGRNGDFDLLVRSVVKRLQDNLGNERSEMILVLPYREKNMEFYETHYDSVIIPSCLCNVHPKGAIVKRNRWMVEQCDLLICYVECENGGAFSAMKYAKKLQKKIINLAVDKEDDWKKLLESKDTRHF